MVVDKNSHAFKILKENYFQPNILHSFKLLVMCKRGIKIFSDIWKIQKYAFRISFFFFFQEAIESVFHQYDNVNQKQGVVEGPGKQFLTEKSSERKSQVGYGDYQDNFGQQGHRTQEQIGAEGWSMPSKKNYWIIWFT